MKIKQLKLKNIGSFYGEHCFSFKTEENQKNIVLIGGRNGAGKTTIFESLRLCLYGYKLYGYRQNSQLYTNKIIQLINDRAKTILPTDAAISLEIMIEDGYSNSIFEIDRKWSLKGNKLKENYIVYQNKEQLSPDELQNFDHYLMQIIPPALFNFHFFDGERISEFIFDQTNGQTFRMAFMQICGLDTFELIEEQLQNNIHARKIGTTDDIYSKYITARKELDNAKENYHAAIDTVQKIQADINSIQEKISLLDQSMKKYGGVERNEWDAYSQEIHREETRRNEFRQTLKMAANDIIPFIIMKKQLAELEKQLNTEERLKRNRLLHDKFSDSSITRKLLQELKPFLTFPDSVIPENLLSALYKALKEDTDINEIEFLCLSENDTTDLLAKIHYYENYEVQNIINTEYAVEESLKHVKELRIKMEEKEVISSDQYLIQKNNLLEQLDIERNHLLESREYLLQTEITLKAAQDKNHKAYEKYKAVLKEKSVTDMAARALLAFEELKQSLYQKYIAAVEDSFSYYFHQLISKTDLIDGIYISSSFEIIAYKQSAIKVNDILEQIQEYGQEYVRTHIGERAFDQIWESRNNHDIISVPLKIEQHFSAGEKQIFVMALYQSLTGIRTTELPFVIDTPLARIDREHRKNILNNFFAKLPGQVIILSTDEEINSEGLMILKEKISDIYLIENQPAGTTTINKDSYFKEVIV